MDISYKKSNAIVNVRQEGDKQVYEIIRNGKKLEMSFVRNQSVKSENITWRGDPHVMGEYIATYDVGVCIDDEKRNFKVSVSGYQFKVRGNKVPSYNVDFSKGIPANEYSSLSFWLSNEVGDPLIGKLMNDYILDADQLQRRKNQQLTFHQKLEDYLK